VRLLHISLNVPAVQRHLVRELIRIQLNFGLAIVHLELQQALDLAHRMLNIHHERILLSLSPADLALLAWVPRDAFRSLADDFPFAMLSENENSSVEQQHHTVKEPVDAFCCLVMLHSLLALRMVDVLAWLHNVRHLATQASCRLAHSLSCHPRREQSVSSSFHFVVNPSTSEELATKRLELSSTRFQFIPALQRSDTFCGCSVA
jgi:hypothetical protein